MMDAAPRFVGKVAVVTGAARGIGRATVDRLGSEGAQVVAVDCDADGLASLRDDVAERVDLFTLAADVGDSAACTEVVEAAAAHFGAVDVLVNNAAIGAFGLSIESTSDAEWEAVLRVNLSSVFYMSRAAVPHLRAAGGGAIVNVSSIHALATSPSVAPYAAAKGAVLALTRTAALDLAADGIRVICIVPGAVDTPMLRAHAERAGVSVAELGFPNGPREIGRVAQPAEVASVIAFAASSDASFVTGCALVADGGALAKF